MKTQVYTLGKTRVQIYDAAYKNKTKEDINQILIRLAQIVKNETEEG